MSSSKPFLIQLSEKRKSKPTFIRSSSVGDEKFPGATIIIPNDNLVDAFGNLFINYIQLIDKLNAYLQSQSIRNSISNGESKFYQDDGTELIQRCLIIKKDHKGYGLTVSGDNPVFVQSVRKDGAADRAGVIEGDRIIKVNGKLVTHANHLEVVRLIKAASYVALTVLGKPTNTFLGGTSSHSRRVDDDTIEIKDDTTFSAGKNITFDIPISGFSRTPFTCERLRGVTLSTTGLPPSTKSIVAPSDHLKKQQTPHQIDNFAFLSTPNSTATSSIHQKTPPTIITNNNNYKCDNDILLNLGGVGGQILPANNNNRKNSDSNKIIHKSNRTTSVESKIPLKPGQFIQKGINIIRPNDQKDQLDSSTIPPPLPHSKSEEPFIKRETGSCSSYSRTAAPASVLPVPADFKLDPQQELIYQKIVTLKRLFNQEALVLRNLQKQYLYNPSYKLKQEIKGVTHRLTSLNENIQSLSHKMLTATVIVPPTHALSPPSIVDGGVSPKSSFQTFQQQQQGPSNQENYQSCKLPKRVNSFEEYDAYDSLARKATLQRSTTVEAPSPFYFADEIGTSFSNRGLNNINQQFKRQNTVVGSILPVDTDMKTITEDLITWDEASSASSQTESAVEGDDMSATAVTKDKQPPYETCSSQHPKNEHASSRNEHPNSLTKKTHRRSTTGSMSSLLDRFNLSGKGANNNSSSITQKQQQSSLNLDENPQDASPELHGVDRYYFQGGTDLTHQTRGSCEFLNLSPLPLNVSGDLDISSCGGGGGSVERINSLYEPFAKPHPPHQNSDSGVPSDPHHQLSTTISSCNTDDWPSEAFLATKTITSSNLPTAPALPPRTYNASTAATLSGLGALEFNLEDGLAGAGGGLHAPALLSDDEENFESHGPYNDIHSLKSHSAHLAVFFNYLFCNSDPNSLLFYLITDYFSHHTANLKDLKRWAYEIHSCFVVPHAPLKVHVPENVIVYIDDTLQNVDAYQNENVKNPDSARLIEALKHIFRPAREHILPDISEKLADFRLKRSLGLSSIYGDSALDQTVVNDKHKSRKVAEQIMYGIIDKLARYWSSPGAIPTELIQNHSDCIRDRDSLLLCATLTICRTSMHLAFKSATVYLHTPAIASITHNQENGHHHEDEIPSSQILQISLDKIPLFCYNNGGVPSGISSRFMMKLPSTASSTKIAALGGSSSLGGSGAKPPIPIPFLGHAFCPTRYAKLTFCNRCHEILSGLGFQGLRCQNCQFNTHRACLNFIDESCLLDPSSSSTPPIGGGDKDRTSSNQISINVPPPGSEGPGPSTVTLRKSCGINNAVNHQPVTSKTASFMSNIIRRRETKSMFMGSPPPPPPTISQTSDHFQENIPEEETVDNQLVTPSKTLGLGFEEGDESPNPTKSLLGPPQTNSSTKKSSSIFATTSSSARSPLKQLSQTKTSTSPSSGQPINSSISSQHTSNHNTGLPILAPADQQLLQQQQQQHQISSNSGGGLLPSLSNRWFNLTGIGSNVPTVDSTTTILNQQQDRIRKLSGTGIGLSEKIGIALKASANHAIHYRNNINAHHHASSNSSANKNNSASNNVGRSESMKAKGENKYPRKKNESQVPRSKSDIAPKALSTEHVVEIIKPVHAHYPVKKKSIDSFFVQSQPKSKNFSDEFPKGSPLIHPVQLPVSGSTINLGQHPHPHPSTGQHLQHYYSRHSHSTSLLKYMELLNTTKLVEQDPDLVETEPSSIPDWQSSCDWDTLKKMKPKEVMRQDVINELFYTERTHVRNLKILDYLFYRPMKLEMVVPDETLDKLFPNLDQLLKIHGDLNDRMKCKKDQNVIVDSVGSMLLAFFGDGSGKLFQEACAAFCKHQPYVLELLKLKQRKDSKLTNFLAEAESNPLCRRLQLKDLLPCEMQRLTKYPLLIENIMKYTTSTESEEYCHLNTAYECARNILAHVNESIRETQNFRRMMEIESKLDKSALEKTYEKAHDLFRLTELRGFKLSDKRLVMEGGLQWKCGRNKYIDVHALLLEDFLLITQKQDDKFVLKFHSTNLGTTTKEDSSKQLSHSPVIRLSNLLTKNVATDKRAFFLVSTVPEGPQLYELIAATSNERKQWLNHIDKTIEKLKLNASPYHHNQHLSSAASFSTTIGPLSTLFPSPSSSMLAPAGLTYSFSNAAGYKQPPTSPHIKNGDREKWLPSELQILSNKSEVGKNVMGGTSSGGSNTPVRHASDPTSKSGSLSPGSQHLHKKYEQRKMSKDDSSMLELQKTAFKETDMCHRSNDADAYATRELIMMVQEEEKKQLQAQEEHLEMIEYIKTPQIVTPSEIKIRDPIPSRRAEPILTLYEQLRRADRLVQRALTEKRLVSQKILQHVASTHHQQQKGQHQTRFTAALVDTKNDHVPAGSPSNSYDYDAFLPHNRLTTTSNLFTAASKMIDSTDPTTGARVRSPSPLPPLTSNSPSHDAETPVEVMLKALEQARSLAKALTHFENSYNSILAAGEDFSNASLEGRPATATSKDVTHLTDILAELKLIQGPLKQTENGLTCDDQRSSALHTKITGSSTPRDTEQLFQLIDLKDDILLISTSINFELSRLFSLMIGMPSPNTLQTLPTFTSTGNEDDTNNNTNNYHRGNSSIKRYQSLLSSTTPNNYNNSSLLHGSSTVVFEPIVKKPPPPAFENSKNAGGITTTTTSTPTEEVHREILNVQRSEIVKNDGSLNRNMQQPRLSTPKSLFLEPIHNHQITAEESVDKNDSTPNEPEEESKLADSIDDQQQLNLSTDSNPIITNPVNTSLHKDKKPIENITEMPPSLDNVVQLNYNNAPEDDKPTKLKHTDAHSNVTKSIVSEEYISQISSVITYETKTVTSSHLSPIK